MLNRHGLSERQACRLMKLSRSSYGYRPKPRDDSKLLARLKGLASSYPRYGYLLLHALLKREGLVINKKRTYRLYTQENLQVRRKKRKRLSRPRAALIPANQINQRWSMDFVSDQLSNGRRFRVLNLVDDFTREIVGQLVDSSISGHQVARMLNQLSETRGLPGSIVCDNGPEFTSKALFLWSEETQVKLQFIQPGKPTQNAYVESFNGKFRENCLDQNWFKDLSHARETIKEWQAHFNKVRPHSSLNYATPAAFAEQAA